ncbi:phage tail family protein [Bacillus cereus group sp. IBL03679]|uniref:phage tail family protein n=1 Tax=Bacillus cereus group sp. IBL03679 TaxID=3240095 RepID=UPI003D2F9A6A
MIPQTLTVITSNGEEFIIETNNAMEVLNFLPPSPLYNAQYEKIDGNHGEIDLGGSFDARDNIRTKILFYAKDIWDFYLFRDEIFKLFASQEPFYIITNRQPGKRWKVRVANTYEIEPQAFGQYGEFNIIFKSASSFCESVGTTMDPFTFDSGLWQIGQNLPAEDLIYKHSTSSFRIYNASDIEIDPRKLPLVIRIRGATNGLTITNRTTADVFKLNIPTTAGDTIELNRVRVFKNGNTVFTSTNRKVIRLAPGWNDFIVSGISGAFQIEFDFRFYYL